MEKEWEEEHYKACRKRKKALTAGVAGVVLIESIVAGGFVNFMHTNQIQQRIQREQEIRRNGCIELAEGIYKGATDFGYFTGEGNFVFTIGSEYTGEWQSNEMDGEGTLKIPSEGEYKDQLVIVNT